MPDYYPLIAKAVGALDDSTGDARRTIYKRARTALIANLRGAEPAWSESDITREQSALEEAIRKVEAEAGRPEKTVVRRGTPRREISWTTVPPLTYASQDGDLSEVKALLAAGADVNAEMTNGATALTTASERGHADVVKALLAAGANVNA